MILKILCGGLFIASGFLKLYPIEPFEYTFVDQGIAGWGMAPFLARGIISLEIFLGILIITGFQKKAVLNTALALLLVFTLYLLYGIIKDGNSRNCGCFGAYIELTPWQAILKNIFLALFLLTLLKFSPGRKAKKKLVIWGIALVSIILPFVLNPVTLQEKGGFGDSGKEQPDLNLLPPFKLNDTIVNFGQGEKILAFLSVNCPHCKHAVYKLSLLQREYKLPPVYCFFIGSESKVDDFFASAKSNYPYVMFQHPDFFRFCDWKIPAFLYLKDGNVINRWDSKTLSPDEFEIIFEKMPARLLFSMPPDNAIFAL